MNKMLTRETLAISVRLCRSGASRPSKKGRVTFVNVQLAIVEIGGTGKRLAFDKMRGTTHDGAWSIFGDDLDALHKSLGILR